jgi:hypothetical protein
MCSSFAADAALYAFASGHERVLCLAHVTNAIGQKGEDFERAKRTEPRLHIAIIRRRLAPT